LAFWLNTKDKNKKCSSGHASGAYDRKKDQRKGVETASGIRLVARATPFVGYLNINPPTGQSAKPTTYQSAPTAERNSTSD
jgi:hypothetical protein